jgi:hypothetical protein
MDRMADYQFASDLATSVPFRWMCCAILVSFVAGNSFRLANNCLRGTRLLAWCVALLAVAAAPCLVPPAALVDRFVAALFSTAILVKLYDLFHQPERARQLSPAAHVLYLINWFWTVLPQKPPTVPRPRDLLQLAFAVPATIVARAATVYVFHLDVANIPFLAEHCLKVTAIALTLIPLTNGLASLWRLLGGRALNPMGNLVTPSTPAEFWRRWNRPAQRFFEYYTFRRMVGMRHPTLGILTAFTISGLGHEYLFAITIGRVQGWQTLYFVLNGLAVAATYRLRPRGYLVPLCVAATIAFNLLASIIFCQSLTEIVPFYSPRN